MTAKRGVTFLLFLTVAITGTPYAIAADDVTGFYVGGNVGQSRSKIDTASIDAAIRAAGAATSATTANEHDTGFKLFGGYRLHPNFAVEAGYFNLGKFSFTTITTGPAATLSGSAKNDNGINLDIVGILPFAEGFSGFARLGVQSSKSTVSITGIGPGGTASVSQSETKTNWKAGLGLQYDFNKNIGARAEWERYRVPDGSGGKANVDLFSVGMLVRF